MALLLNAGDTVSRSYSYTQPSPLHPSLPQGTGERTGNLIPECPAQTEMLDGVNWNVSSNGKITGNGTTTSGTIFYILRNYSIPLKAGTYTLSFVGRKNISLILRNVTTSTTICAAWSTNSSATFTIDDDIPVTDKISLYFNTSQTGTSVDVDGYPMLNLGSTALPYEPYGYKIPISSANTTTPVYLGEVETTRKVKKLEFTGNETIGAYDSTYNRFSIIIADSLIIGVRLSPVICSHYQAISDGRGIANVPNNAIYSDTGTSRWFIKTTEYTNDTDFKAYLAQQYAAGTPVCVWYVLATPQTAVVNEPLMRIGDYADTLSKAQAGVSIPTNNGSTTVDVDTTVKPSEVYIKYMG